MDWLRLEQTPLKVEGKFVTKYLEIFVFLWQGSFLICQLCYARFMGYTEYNVSIYFYQIKSAK